MSITLRYGKCRLLLLTEQEKLPKNGSFFMLKGNIYGRKSSTLYFPARVIKPKSM